MRAAFGFYLVGLALLLLGVTGIGVSGPIAWAVGLSGLAAVILGIVVEERYYKADQ
jgi:hypothetical protein